MKKGGTHLDKDVKQYVARLEEILVTPIGALTEEAVLDLVTERKQLEEAIREHEEQKQKEQLETARLKQEREETRSLIEKLNLAISPDKDDEELLRLVAERKELEVKLETIEKELTSVKVEIVSPEPEEMVEEGSSQENKEEKEEVLVTEEVPLESVATEVVPEAVVEVVEKQEIVSEIAPAPEEIGNEGIIVDRIEESGELTQYLDQLRGSENSLGMFLQSVPQNIKRSKKFMLKVAEIDPAYAMHYADLVLKQDEDFNIRVVNFPNKRNSGNVLAEMLPEARTAKVVIIAVRQDYRNIRFALPNMENYREMIDIAKKGALEKVKALKDGADVSLLVPKILQKDPEFMREVEGVVVLPSEEEEVPDQVDAKHDTESHPGVVVDSSAKKSAWSIHHSGL